MFNDGVFEQGAIWPEVGACNVLRNYPLYMYYMMHCGWCTISRVVLVVVTLCLLGMTGIGTLCAAEALDNGPYVSRSNVMESTVDPSFWDDREPLTIAKLDKPLTLPGKPVIVKPQVSKPLVSSDLSPEEWTIVSKAQDVALLLVNNPSYQAGVTVFKLGDTEQIQLSSVKYAATRQYYGRTDVASSWVTDLYNAAYSDDYQNVTRLLEELPPEV